MAALLILLDAFKVWPEKAVNPLSFWGLFGLLLIALHLFFTSVTYWKIFN